MRVKIKVKDTNIMAGAELRLKPEELLVVSEALCLMTNNDKASKKDQAEALRLQESIVRSIEATIEKIEAGA